MSVLPVMETIHLAPKWEHIHKVLLAHLEYGTGPKHECRQELNRMAILADRFGTLLCILPSDTLRTMLNDLEAYNTSSEECADTSSLCEFIRTQFALRSEAL